MKQLLLRSFVRGLGGVAAMATLPLLTRAAAVGAKHGKAAAKKAWQTATDEICAARHGLKHYRSVRKTLRRAAATQP